MVAAILFGVGGGAYAVASLGPDPSDLPVRQILEAVQPSAAPAAEQAEQLDAHHFTLYRSDTTHAGDSAATLLRRLGVDDAEAAAFIRSDAQTRKSLLGGAGRSVTAQAGDDQHLIRLTARWITDASGKFHRLVVERTPQGFTSRVETAPLMAVSQLGSATIDTTLVAAADEAKIPDGVLSQIVDIFGSDIDFQNGLKKGDRFSVVYETLQADGEPISGGNVTGRVLSAEFVNRGKTYSAVWFQDPIATGAARRGSYYTLDGRSLHHAFLKSPVKFSHITSGFQMRFDPILRKWKMHEGIDFAGPIGTPVRTVADGVVQFAGQQTGYGNVIFIRHRPGPDGSHVTVYAHLSRILVHQGESVTQGEDIGRIGQTGWATGPHLHFEYRVNGVYRNPVLLAQQSDTAPLAAAECPAFEQRAASMRMQLADAALIKTASSQ